MNYLLSLVLLCFILSGCSALGVQLGKADTARSLKAARTAPHAKELGPGHILRTVSARLAATNTPPKVIRDSFSASTDPDQF